MFKWLREKKEEPKVIEKSYPIPENSIQRFYYLFDIVSDIIEFKKEGFYTAKHNLWRTIEELIPEIKDRQGAINVSNIRKPVIIVRDRQDEQTNQRDVS